MPRSWITALFAAPSLVLGVHGPLAGQATLLKPGVRVRATTHPEREAVVGTLVRVEHAVLVIDVAEPDSALGAELRLSQGQLRILEVSQGLRSNIGSGVLTGAALGAAAGIALVIGECGLSDNECSDPSTTTLAAIFGAVGAASGALLGGVIGALSKTERWAEVPLAHLRLTVTVRRELRVAITLPFRP